MLQTLSKLSISQRLHAESNRLVYGLLLVLALVAVPLFNAIPVYAAATWNDITPPPGANPWTSVSFLGEVDGTYYVAMRYNDGGNRYLIYEMSDSSLTEITPTGDWSSVSSPVEQNGKLYFVLRDTSNLRQIYELDSGTWTNVTPPGDWAQGGAGVAFEGNLYFSLENDTSGNYHLWEYSSDVWDDITPTPGPNPWTLASLLGEVDGKYYVAMRYSDGGNRYLLYEMTGGNLTEVTPTGTWTSIVNTGVELDGKSHFVFRDASALTQHLYELDGGSFTEVTPTGTWDQGGAGAAFEGNGYFVFREDSSDDYYLWEYSNGVWNDITPTPDPSHPWTLASLLGQVGDKYYVSMRYSDGGNSYRLYEMTGGNLTEVTPSGTWRAMTGVIDLGGVGYFTLADTSFLRYVYQLEGGTWTDMTPTGTWDQGGNGPVFERKGYYSLQNQSTAEYHLYELDPPNGNVTIALDATPEDDTSFNFSGDGEFGTFSLQDPSDSTRMFTDMYTGTYTITQTVPAGWTLSDAACTGGSYTSVTNGVSVTVGEDEDITCTFTNEEEQTGDLTIVHEATPEDDTPFNFSGDGGLGSFMLSDPSDNTETFADLDVGTYTITETVPAGWTLNDASCTGGSYVGVTNGVEVTVADGDNVICTFTNEEEQTGNLTIVHEATPEDDTPFDFSGDGGLGSFTLSDPSDNTETFADLDVGTYTVTETVPAGWTLNDASCTGGSYVGVINGVEVTVGDGDDITCTFTNVAEPDEDAGNVTIVLDATPEDDTPFNFSGDGGIGSFTLSDPSDDTETFLNLDVGTYTITETVPAGWTLSDASCTGGSYTAVTNGVEVTISDGDNITCTFTNSKVWMQFLPIAIKSTG